MRIRCLGTVCLLALASSCGGAPQVYDLVILNGRVMDPASGLDAARSLGITGDSIGAVSEQLPGTILDRATYREPLLPPIGLRDVVVNGVVVVRDGKLKPGVMPGRPVRGPVQTPQS